MTKNLSGKLQSHLRTKSVNKTSHHAVSVTQFPAKQPLSLLPAVSIHKPRHEGSQNVSTKNSSNNIFLLFSGSSSASKYQYQFNDMLSVINAEFHIITSLWVVFGLSTLIFYCDIFRQCSVITRGKKSHSGYWFCRRKLRENISNLLRKTLTRTTTCQWPAITAT